MLGVSEPQLLQKEAVGGHFFMLPKRQPFFRRCPSCPIIERTPLLPVISIAVSLNRGIRYRLVKKQLKPDALRIHNPHLLNSEFSFCAASSLTPF